MLNLVSYVRLNQIHYQLKVEIFNLTVNPSEILKNQKRPKISSWKTLSIVLTLVQS